MLKTEKPKLEEHSIPIDIQENCHSSNVQIDIDRMEFSLTSERFQVPKGMTREQTRKFITSVGNTLT